MTTQEQHQEWVEHPTGKIPKGTYCDSCGRYNSRPVACNAVLVNDQDEMLLVLRGEEPDKKWWDIPGGYLDWDETLEECAARELQEETNLVVQSTDFSQFYIFSNPQNKAKNQVIDIYFYSRSFSGDISVDGKEILEAQWFPLSDFPKKLAFDHIHAIRSLKENFLKKP